MTTTIRIPELGEGIDTVDVVAVLVKIGDTIAVDQPLIEVETDKAAVEVPSTTAGTVTEVHVEAGASLGPDAPIVTVDEDTTTEPGNDPTETQPIAAPEQPPSAPPVETAATGGSEARAASAAGTATVGSVRGSDNDSVGDHSQGKQAPP